MARRFSPSIYHAPADGRFYAPFNLHVHPMQRFFRLHFEKDADALYRAFEIQVYENPAGGSAMLVAAYRQDHRVDVYHQPGLTLAQKNIDILGGELGTVAVCPLENAHCFVERHGVQVFFAFTDIKNRAVTVSVEENNVQPTQPCAILAPPQSHCPSPESLALLHLNQCHVVRRPGAEINIHIEQRQHQPDALSARFSRSPAYYAYCAAEPLPVTWNSAHTGPLSLHHPTGSGTYQDGTVDYDLTQNDGHYEILRLHTRRRNHDFLFTFSPPVPDLAALHDGIALKGRIRLACDPALGSPFGSLTGTYGVQRQAATVRVQIQPGRWRPNIQPGPARRMVRSIRAFKRWPQSYRWTSTIDFGAGDPILLSGWHRLG